MKLDEITLESKRIYDGKILKLDLDTVELPDGSEAKRECVRHSGGAAVLFVNDGKIALVKQYRYLYGEAIYEIPAGKVEERESSEISAMRELEEETGYRAKNLQFLFKLYPTPGYTDEIIYVYFTNEATFMGQKLDEGEFLNCEFVEVDRVLKMIERGEICDAKTVSAVYKYLYEKK